MELTTAQKLADLNRRFYEDHAAGYARARATPQPGIRRILAMIPPGARVLEIGCGDGKVARALVADSDVAAYFGLDLSPAMLARAAVMGDEGQKHLRRPSSVVRPSFALADLTSPDWPRVLPPEPFTYILAFAVLHHLPGFETRARVLRTLAEHLAPGGACAVSNWQFARSERLKRRIVPWSTLGLSENDVEPGDYLLTWERNKRSGLRYVHILDEAEARRMAAGAGLRVVEVFRADGVSGDLADYVRMRKSG
jgi:SAM-dependent methyltransferase